MTRLLALCFGVAILSGCTDGGSDAAGEGASTSTTASPSSSPASQADTAPKPPPAPSEGACYRIPLDEAARPTNDREPVPCSRAHTARTFHVGRLDTVVEGHSIGVDSERVQRQLAETCPRELAEFLGGDTESRSLSRFQAIWFSPTVEQYDAGADWFRCDVVALATPEELLELPSEEPLRGVLDRPGTLATYGLCGTAQPGADGFERVACALPHSWVAIRTIPLQGGDSYPGTDAVREAGDGACSDEVAGRNELLLEYSYGWEWPTAEQWASGQRYGFCWAPNDLV